jgi:hypothetical protein
MGSTYRQRGTTGSGSLRADAVARRLRVGFAFVTTLSFAALAEHGTLTDSVALRKPAAEVVSHHVADLELRILQRGRRPV